MAAGRFNHVAVIVQCRLSSTRLPQKALKLLGSKETLCWTLDAMKKVKADRYFVACDYDSKSALQPLAKKCGWELYAGDRDNVLDRFCSLVKSQFAECDLVVRATGDNPFLFWEAAQKSVQDFEQNEFDADYFTYSGLPHGSGVELFKAASILKAQELTDSPYDKEHVGPALYRHQETFKCVFKDAPKEFYAPELRTTIDTFADYKRAVRLQNFLQGQKALAPFCANDVLAALKNPSLQKTVLLVPSVKAGRGTGHLRRALSVAKEIGAFVYVPQDKSLKEADALVSQAVKDGLKEWQITSELMGGWDLVCLDLFRSTKEEIKKYSDLGPLCAIDDGADFCKEADYLLDVIPSMPRSGKAALKSNLFKPALIELPKNRRASFPVKIKKALVCVSGETIAELSGLARAALQELGVDVVEVTAKNPLSNLRERLFEYDLVVTHYGFTAFEAAAANCAVLLLGTSGLHKKLSKKYGFVCLCKNQLAPRKLRPLLEGPQALDNKGFKALLGLGTDSAAPLGLSKPSGNAAPLGFAKPSDSAAPLGLEKASGLSPLASFIQGLSFAQKFPCPVCGPLPFGGAKVLARTEAHTFRRCPKCGMVYLSLSSDSRVQYEADYFGSEYKAQYGRTYLDDFDSIKAQGLRRALVIARAGRFGLKKPNGSAAGRFGLSANSASAKPRLLDIGCAYGPFLAAANELGFEPYGTDISQSALDYVKNKLGFSAVRSNFADFDPQKEFGFKEFDAVAMWYVIEHCQDLKALLPRVNKLLKEGGIFAFSTPSGSGVSGRFNRSDFFENSPRDHYTVWEPSRAAKILRRFGFKLVKAVPTGIHPERIGLFKNISKKSFIFKLLAVFCKKAGLGDTFEVYCKKIKEAR